MVTSEIEALRLRKSSFVDGPLEIPIKLYPLDSQRPGNIPADPEPAGNYLAMRCWSGCVHVSNSQSAMLRSRNFVF